MPNEYLGQVKVSSIEFRKLCEDSAKLALIREILEQEKSIFGDYRVLRQIVGIKQPDEEEKRE